MTITVIKSVQPSGNANATAVDSSSANVQARSETVPKPRVIGRPFPKGYKRAGPGRPPKRIPIEGWPAKIDTMEDITTATNAISRMMGKGIDSGLLREATRFLALMVQVVIARREIDTGKAA